MSPRRIHVSCYEPTGRGVVVIHLSKDDVRSELDPIFGELCRIADDSLIEMRDKAKAIFMYCDKRTKSCLLHDIILKNVDMLFEPTGYIRRVNHNGLTVHLIKKPHSYSL